MLVLVTNLQLNLVYGRSNNRKDLLPRGKIEYEYDWLFYVYYIHLHLYLIFCLFYVLLSYVEMVDFDFNSLVNIYKLVIYKIRVLSKISKSSEI
jgi:hypothetical protein